MDSIWKRTLSPDLKDNDSSSPNPMGHLIHSPPTHHHQIKLSSLKSNSNSLYPLHQPKDLNHHSNHSIMTQNSLNQPQHPISLNSSIETYSNLHQHHDHQIKKPISPSHLIKSNHQTHSSPSHSTHSNSLNPTFHHSTSSHTLPPMSAFYHLHHHHFYPFSKSDEPPPSTLNPISLPTTLHHLHHLDQPISPFHLNSNPSSLTFDLSTEHSHWIHNSTSKSPSSTEPLHHRIGHHHHHHHHHHNNLSPTSSNCPTNTSNQSSASSSSTSSSSQALLSPSNTLDPPTHTSSHPLWNRHHTTSDYHRHHQDHQIGSLLTQSNHTNPHDFEPIVHAPHLRQVQSHQSHHTSSHQNNPIDHRPKLGIRPSSFGSPQDEKPISIYRKGSQFGLSLADIEVICTLGTGTFGKVLLIKLEQTFYAMKVLSKVEIVRLKQVEHMNSEKDLLGLVSNVGNEFCVKLICTFQDEKNLYMILDFIQGGELFSHLRRAGRFTSDVSRFFAANVLLALEGLHELDIVYRDLKPENILLGPNGYVKLTDFGFAKKVPDRTWTLCGTPEYLAPEIITSKGHGKPADYWAYGILIYEMLSGFPPFFNSESGPFGIYEKILSCQLNFPSHIDLIAQDLIKKLLTSDRSKRLGNLKGGINDIKSHDWFAGVDWDSLSKQTIRAPILPRIGLPGDSSNFEKYPEVKIEDLPGIMRAQMNRHGAKFQSPEIGSDPYGHLFESF